MSNDMRTVSCVCIVLIAFTTSKAQGWRGIVPLQSTRADVERSIGSPMEPNGITYDLKTERVNVIYSRGACVKQAEWNVADGTVIGITIYPQTRLMISSLHSDLNRFEKFINPHNPDRVSYNNKEEGVSIGTESSGRVLVIEYFPAAKDSHLRCPNSSSRLLSLDQMEYYKFDEYSNLSFSDEKARLDNFTAYLRREPDMKAYLVVYESRGTRRGEAKRRASRAKRYLVMQLGLDSKRVVTIEGGHREKAKVELYALPPDLSGPGQADQNYKTRPKSSTVTRG